MAAVYDHDTIVLMRKVLSDAWSSLSPTQQREALQSELGQRILKVAAEGERDPIKLRKAALGMQLA